MTRKRSLPAGAPWENADLSMLSISRATVTILLATIIASNSILDASAFAQAPTSSRCQQVSNKIGPSSSSDGQLVVLRGNRVTSLHRLTAVMTSSSVLDAPPTSIEDQKAGTKNLEVSLVRSLRIEASGGMKANIYTPDKNKQRVLSLHGADVRFRRIKAVDLDSLSRTNQRSLEQSESEKATRRTSKLPKLKSVTTRKGTLRKPKQMNVGRPSRSVDASFRSENGRQRLTREEEGRLTIAIRGARQILAVRDRMYKNDASRPPTEEEWAVASGISLVQLRRTLEEGKEAQSILVSANIHLVASIAKKHYFALKRSNDATNGMGGLALQDFIQEGNLGLLAAAERFDPSRGFRFSTYAHYWIRQRILKSISDSSRVIRLPESVSSKLRKIDKARKQMYSEIGREPSEPELAHYMQIPIKQLRSLTLKARSVVSLESPIKCNSHKSDHLDRQTIGDLIASDTLMPEEDAQRQYLQNDIRAVINQELAEREREVLVARFGLDCGEALSASHTAQLLGVTVDQVRVIEARALNKLRSPQRNHRLKGYVHLKVDENEKTSYQHLKDLYSNSVAPAPAADSGNSRGRTDDKQDLVQQNKQFEKLWFF